MSTLPFWSLIPTLAALAGIIALFFLAHRQGWNQSPITESTSPVEKEAENESNAQDLKSRLILFITQYRWELLLAKDLRNSL